MFTHENASERTPSERAAMNEARAVLLRERGTDADAMSADERASIEAETDAAIRAAWQDGDNAVRLVRNVRAARYDAGTFLVVEARASGNRYVFHPATGRYGPVSGNEARTLAMVSDLSDTATWDLQGEAGPAVYDPSVFNVLRTQTNTAPATVGTVESAEIDG